MILKEGVGGMYQLTHEKNGLEDGISGDILNPSMITKTCKAYPEQDSPFKQSVGGKRWVER